MEINNLSRRELIDMIEDIKNLLDGKKLPKQDFYIENESKQSGLENLIGTIPFLLLNQDIFEKNIDIIDFAKNLGIHIPAAEKKNREDLIGRVVSAIARFDSKRIAELNLAIKSLNRSNLRRSKSNFFKDWETLIKEIKL